MVTDAASAVGIVSVSGAVALDLGALRRLQPLLATAREHGSDHRPPPRLGLVEGDRRAVIGSRQSKRGRRVHKCSNFRPLSQLRSGYPYYAEGFTRWLCLHEKGGKEHRMPVHHQLVEYLETYLDASGIRGEPGSPLFRSALRRTGLLTELPLDRRNALAMIKRRAAQAGVSPALSPHSFRAMAITFYLENGGSLEEARDMANHADTRTTKLYDRAKRVITQSAVERIRV